MTDELEATQLIVTFPEEQALSSSSQSKTTSTEFYQQLFTQLKEEIVAIYQRYVETPIDRSSYPQVADAHQGLKGCVEQQATLKFSELLVLLDKLIELAKQDDPYTVSSYFGFSSRHTMTTELEIARADCPRNIEKVKKWEEQQAQTAANINSEQTSISANSAPMSEDEKDKLIAEKEKRIQELEFRLEQTETDLNQTRQQLAEASQFNLNNSHVGFSHSFWQNKNNLSRIPKKTPASESKLLKEILDIAQFNFIEKLIENLPYFEETDMEIVKDLIFNLLVDKNKKSMKKIIPSVLANANNKPSSNLKEVIRQFILDEKIYTSKLPKDKEIEFAFDIYNGPCYLLPDDRARQHFEKLLKQSKTHTNMR